MGDGKNVKDLAAEIVIGAATAVSSAATGAQATIAAADVADPIKDSAIVLIENADNALSKAAGGIKAGKAAAGASPVPEPEAADHTDPPDRPESEALASGWAEDSESGWGEKSDGEWAGRADGDWAGSSEPAEAGDDGGEGVR
ncbi:hypothetical protein OG474_41790 [Kribbella sp. NBC_01505]|uniref:hypothetical protein n=1 Tax=Kribbella sp. NBC_01505 TaxID=2903580 RepID=UPI00386D3F3A